MPRWLPEPLSQFGCTWRSMILRYKQLASIVRIAAVESVRLQDGKTIWRSISTDMSSCKDQKSKDTVRTHQALKLFEASCWLPPNSIDFFRRSQSGLVFLAKFGVNLPNWLIMLRNQRNLVTFFGSFIFWIALSLHECLVCQLVGPKIWFLCKKIHISLNWVWSLLLQLCVTQLSSACCALLEIFHKQGYHEWDRQHLPGLVKCQTYSAEMFRSQSNPKCNAIKAISAKGSNEGC